LCDIQFGGQAPGSSEDERQAAINKFGFEFDVMDKLLVNGPDAHPLYKFLKERQPVSVPQSSRTPPGSNAIEWYAEVPVLTVMMNGLL
jgi:glutathione peroxidase-family protein